MTTTLKAHYITDLEHSVFMRHGSEPTQAGSRGTTIAVPEDESCGAADLSDTPSKSKAEVTKVSRSSPMS